MKQLRPLVSSTTAPLIRWLASTPITPNQLTVIGTGLTAAVATAIAFLPHRLAAILTLLATAFDLLDGALARSTGRTSRFGAFLDSSLDRVGDGLLLLGVAARATRQHDGLTPLLAFVAFGASVMVSYTRARAEGLGLQGEAGFFDRPARIAVLSAGLFFDKVTPALVVVAGGAALTVVQRILLVRRQLED